MDHRDEGHPGEQGSPGVDRRAAAHGAGAVEGQAHVRPFIDQPLADVGTEHQGHPEPAAHEDEVNGSEARRIDSAQRFAHR